MSTGAPTISRRRLLLAGTTGLVLAACSVRTLEDEAVTSTTEPDEATPAPDDELDDELDGDDPGIEEPPGATASGLLLVRLFAASQPFGTQLRLPLVLTDDGGNPVPEPPGRLQLRVGPDGAELGPPVRVERRDRGVPLAYFPLRTTFDEPGAWRIVAETGGTIVETVVSAVDPATLPAVPAAGDRLPRLQTPTRRAPRGADPLCTADPPCPLHRVSLGDALDGDRPLALLVTSPATCTSGACAAAVDLLAGADTTGLDAIHVEATTNNGASPTTLARVLELGFDPALFLVDAAGEVVERLDHVVDGVELGAALRRLRA